MSSRFSSAQLQFEPIVDHTRSQMHAAIDAYMAQHRAQYIDYARDIAPNTASWQQVWDRFAFAILTANTEVDNAVNALALARMLRGLPVGPRRLHGITGERASFVNALPIGPAVLGLLREYGETWHAYRMRIVKQVRGLALTKATYAACLVYPLDADVACLDVWMQRVFMPDRPPTHAYLRDSEYLAMEQQVREFARRHRVCTALAQWMIWDWIRGGRPSPQRYF